MNSRNNTCSIASATRAMLIGRLRSTALIALAFSAMSILSPQLLFAHARLTSSDPAAGASVKAPTRVRLVFSEEPVLSMSRFHLMSTRGDTVALGTLRVDPSDAHALIADFINPIAAGKYELHWGVAARDGHASKGTLTFTVDSSTTATPTTKPSMAVMTATPVDPAKTSPMRDGMAEQSSTDIGGVLTRLLSFVSIFLVIGAVAFRLFVLARSGSIEDAPFIDVASTNTATLGMTASLGVLVSALLKIARESAEMPEVSLGTMLSRTVWGWSLIITAAAALVSIVAFWRIHSAQGYARNFWWRMTLLMAVIFAVTPALSGHAIGSDRALLTVPSDIIHLAAGSLWLGTLAVILIVGISAALKAPDVVSPGVRVAGLINAFSPLALTCGAIVVATGLIAAIVHLPSVNSLWTTSYGSALFRKLIFVGLLFLTGAWNWQRMKPRLNTDEALGTLRRSATIEVLFAAVVLVLTAILVALELP